MPTKKYFVMDGVELGYRPGRFLEVLYDLRIADAKAIAKQMDLTAKQIAGSVSAIRKQFDAKGVNAPFTTTEFTHRVMGYVYTASEKVKRIDGLLFPDDKLLMEGAVMNSEKLRTGTAEVAIDSPTTHHSWNAVDDSMLLQLAEGGKFGDIPIFGRGKFAGMPGSWGGGDFWKKVSTELLQIDLHVSPSACHARYRFISYEKNDTTTSDSDCHNATPTDVAANGGMLMELIVEQRETNKLLRDLNAKIAEVWS